MFFKQDKPKIDEKYLEKFQYFKKIFFFFLILAKI